MNLCMAQAAELGGVTSRGWQVKVVTNRCCRDAQNRSLMAVLRAAPTSQFEKASFHAVVLAHAARRSEALQDLTWHATRLPAAGACLAEWAKIELVVGAAQGGCVLQLGRAVSSSCAVLRRCGPCRPGVCVAA